MGDGDRLRAPLKPIQCLWCFFLLMMVRFYRYFNSSLHSSKKSVSELSWTSSDKISGSAHDQASHGMFCCIFLMNILQNRRKRISAKLLDDGTRHGHTKSQPAHIVGQPSVRQRSAIQMFQMLHSKRGRKECGEAGGGGGGGVGDRLESPLKPIQCLCCFSSFACVVVVFLRFFLGGGGG